MKKIKITLQLILFIILILLCSKVSAASITLSPNKNNITSGDEFTISMNLSDANLASLNVKITVDTSKVDYISSTAPDNTNFNNGKILYTWTDTSGGENPKGEGTIVTFRLKSKSSGNANFSVTGKFYDANENSVNMTLNGTSVKINQDISINPPETNTNEVTNNNTTNENNNGEIQEPDNNEQPPEENNNNQPSTSEENNQPPEVNNQENPNNNLSTNAYLKSLQVDIEGISPRFNKNTTKYYLIIDDTVDSVKVNAIPEDPNAKIDINGNTNLQNGINTITVTVTAPNGITQKKYLIEVTKTNNPNNANTNLENLAIENVTLNPEFQVDVLEYSASVGKDVESLKILAVPEVEGVNVIITGAEKLSFGNNIITITVTSKNGSNIKNYIVNVYKKTEAEEQEEQNRLLEENINNSIREENTNQNNDITNKKNNNMLWVIFIILLVVVIVIVTYLIWKNKKKK